MGKRFHIVVNLSFAFDSEEEARLAAEVVRQASNAFAEGLSCPGYVRCQLVEERRAEDIKPTTSATSPMN